MSDALDTLHALSLTRSIVGQLLRKPLVHVAMHVRQGWTLTVQEQPPVTNTQLVPKKEYHHLIVMLPKTLTFVAPVLMMHQTAVQLLVQVALLQSVRLARRVLRTRRAP